MAQVQISINNQNYTVTCDDGQEERLQELASYLDGHVQALAERVGRITDARLMLLAGLTVCDELKEMERRLHETEEGKGMTSEEGAARVISTAAKRVRDVTERM